MNTYDRLIKVFHSVFENEIDIDKVTYDSSLREDIGISSIGLLYIAMALEEEFSIKFTNQDFAEISTVGDVISCIERKI